VRLVRHRQTKETVNRWASPTEHRASPRPYHSAEKLSVHAELRRSIHRVFQHNRSISLILALAANGESIGLSVDFREASIQCEGQVIRMEKIDGSFGIAVELGSYGFH